MRYHAPREHGDALRFAGLYSVPAPFDTVDGAGWAVAALGATLRLHPVSPSQRAAILYGLRFDPRFHEGCALCLAGSLDAAVEYVRAYLPEVAFGRNTSA